MSRRSTKLLDKPGASDEKVEEISNGSFVDTENQEHEVRVDTGNDEDLEIAAPEFTSERPGSIIGEENNEKEAA